MRLDEFRRTVQASDPDDWYVIKHQGPSYHDWLAGTVSEGGYRLEVNTHYATASYKPDISLTVGWGMSLDFEHRGERAHDRTYEWSKVLSDSRVRLAFADFFWCGALVDRFTYVVADGGRAVLPWAVEVQGLKTTQWEHDTAKLLHHLGDHIEGFEEYFRKVGFQIDGT